MIRFTHTQRVTENRFSRRSFLQALGGFALVGAQPQVAPKITSTDLGNGLWLFQGSGCNVVAMGSPDGVLIIDGGLAANSSSLVKVVKERTGSSRINTLINTHWHPEQVGSNEAAGQDGAVIIAHEKTAMYLGNTVTSVIFPGRFGPLPKVAQPNKTTRTGGSLKFAGTQIDYGYLPAAHTDGDLYVHFPEMNLLIGGGVVSGEEWPLLDYHNGAWLGGRVRAYERLAALVHPDTRVVPANGRLITGKDIERQSDIYEELFRTMIGYMNMGYGPEDAAEHNVLKPYQSEYGDASAFLYGAYRSMLIAYVPD